MLFSVFKAVTVVGSSQLCQNESQMKMRHLGSFRESDIAIPPLACDQLSPLVDLELDHLSFEQMVRPKFLTISARPSLLHPDLFSYYC